MDKPPFPVRPLPVFLPAPESRLQAFIFALVMFVLAGGLAAISGPELVRDYRVLGHDVPAAAQLVEGRCHTRFMVLRICEGTIERQTAAGPVREATRIGFIDFDTRRYRTELLQREGDPDTVTTSLALDEFWNRAGLVAVLLALFLAGAWASLRRALRPEQALNTAFATLDKAVLTPVPVTLSGHRDIRGLGRVWRYRPEGAASPGESRVRLAPGSDPFLLDRRGDRALGVRGPQGGEPLLLDGDLTVIGLTNGERDALHAWQRARLAGAGPRLG